jgi:hypothetical protein
MARDEEMIAERLMGGFLVNKDRGWIGVKVGRGSGRMREGDKSKVREGEMRVSC